MNVMSKNIHRNFDIGQAKKSGQITKVDNMFLPTGCLCNYLGIGQTHKYGQ